MRKYTIPIPACIFLIFLISFGSESLVLAARVAAEGPRTNTFFCQGQAAYDPRDQAKSQQMAVQDFMAQGLTQAIGSFLSPAQLGTQFSEIQKNLLTKPSKYIDSYQVFSETQLDGMFRVIGQVTVSMDALKKDLEQSGILAAQQKTGAPPAPSQAINAPAAAAASEEAQDDESASPSEEAEASQPAASHPPAPQPQVDEQGTKTPATTRGIAPTKGEVLWVVSEKWEQEWNLPTEGVGDRFQFAQSLAGEMDGYGFSIHLPMSGSVRMDLSGSVPSSQVISLAEGLGIQDVVVGKVSYTQDRTSNQVSLDANLRVIRIGQGKSEFELHKAQSMEDLSNQEGAHELAARVASQLSTLLGGPRAGHGASASGPGQGTSSAQMGSLGQLTIYLPSAQYSYWSELETILRQQWKNMQINGLEIGQTEGVVKLDGVSGDYILKMSGTPLPSGAALKVDSYSTEAHTMKISFVPPEKSRPKRNDHTKPAYARTHSPDTFAGMVSTEQIDVGGLFGLFDRRFDRCPRRTAGKVP